jgi:hypothetical protein
VTTSRATKEAEQAWMNEGRLTGAINEGDLQELLGRG